MIRKLLILASVISLAMFAGCDASVCVGGSDGIACYTDIAAVTAASPSATITGAIEAPEASASISKSISKAVASGVTGHVYTLEGDDCGEFTTDSGGAFTLTCPVTTLMDADDTDPLNFTTTLKMEASNGIQKIVAVTVTGVAADISNEIQKTVAKADASYTTIDAGTADTEDTLAAATYLAELPEGVDLNCWLDSMKAFWRTADVDGDGLSPTSGKLQAVMKDYLAGGYSPLDLGYPTHGDLLKAVIKGEGATAFSAMATKVGKTDYQDAYSDAVTIASSYGIKTEKEYADSTCTGGASSSLSKASAGDTSCGDATADEAAAKMFLEGNSVVIQAVNEAASDGFSEATCELKKACIAQADCSGVLEKASAYQAFLNSYEFDFSGFTAEKVRSAAGECEAEDRLGYKDCGVAMYESTASLGWDNVDADDLKILGSYYSAQVSSTSTAFHATTEDYTSVPLALTSGAYSFSVIESCMTGQLSAAGWKDCFNGIGAATYGTCTSGCPSGQVCPTLCPSGQVCTTSNVCGACTSAEQCRAYLNNVTDTIGLFLCSNGVCLADESPASVVAAACTTSAQCPLASPSVVGHKMCVNNSCSQCASDAQCVASFGAGYRCGNGGIGKLACISATECFDLTNCGTGQICSNSGSCGACTNDASCTPYGNGFTCQSGLCSNVPPPPPPCASALDCGVTPLPPGANFAYKLCVTGTCSFCTTNLQCTGATGPGAGYGCAGPGGSKVCVTPPPPP